MRLRLRIAAFVAAGSLALLTACSPATPDEHYDCTCTVTCGSQDSTTDVTVCESQDNSGQVAGDAKLQCERQTTTCSAPVCACSCTRSGDC